MFVINPRHVVFLDIAGHLKEGEKIKSVCVCVCVCVGGGGGGRAVMINILNTVGKNTRNVMFFHFFYMDLLFFLLACVFALLDGF